MTAFSRRNPRTDGPVQQSITAKLRSRFEPAHLEVTNQSHTHNVPPGSESHFKVVVVSAVFDGQRLVQRHRMVNDALGEELAGPVHALSIEAMTPEQWEARGGATQPSPPCLGGSKADQEASR